MNDAIKMVFVPDNKDIPMTDNITEEIKITCLASIEEAITCTQESGYTICMSDTAWGGGETTAGWLVFCRPDSLYGHQFNGAGNTSARGKPGEVPLCGHRQLGSGTNLLHCFRFLPKGLPFCH